MINQKIYLSSVLLILFFTGCVESGLLNPSDKLKNIAVLDFYIENDAYLNLLSNKTLNYAVPANIFYNSSAYGGSIRASGAGSRFDPRWSYRVRLNEGEVIENLNSFNLSAQIYDRTMLNTTIASHLYHQAGFLTFDNYPAFIRINEHDQGLLQLIELLKQDFFDRRNVQVHELYKVGSDSKFTFQGTNNPQFTFDKKIPDDENYSNIYNLILAMDTSSTEKILTSLGKFLDIKMYIRYHALTSLINNTDAFRNNFFIYRRSVNSPFICIPWDFDQCFRRTYDVGLYGENAIINRLFQNDSTRNMYVSQVKDLVNSIYTEQNIIDSVIVKNQEIIRDAYNIDPYLGAGRYDFDTEIEKLIDFIKDRREYFLNNIDSLGPN